MMTTAITAAGKLGEKGPRVSPLGLGCWAIGGPFLFEGKPDGWGAVDDAESIRAINRAADLGVTFFDTAEVYGPYVNEELVGEALHPVRDQVVIATKFGYVLNEARREITGSDLSARYIRRACEASLARLGTDRIDLYQLHIGDAGTTAAEDTFAVLEDLADEGKIRAYGWSTDEPHRASQLAGRGRAAAVQFRLNVLSDAPEMITVCNDLGLAALARTPLAMGLLTGKFSVSSTLPADDVRGGGHSWVTYFSGGRPSREFLGRLAAIRDILTSGGRTLAQGSLAWVMARGAIPIPGFKSLAQAEDNAGTLAHGPLTPAQLAEIDALLAREPQETPGSA